MKTFAILLCTLYFASYTVVRADEENAINSCLQKYGINAGESDLQKQLTGEEEDIYNNGCILACYMQNTGLMTGNTINEEEAITAAEDPLDGTNKKALVSECVKLSPVDDECKVAAGFVNCLKMGIAKSVL